MLGLVQVSVNQGFVSRFVVKARRLCDMEVNEYLHFHKKVLSKLRTDVGHLKPPNKNRKNCLGWCLNSDLWACKPLFYKLNHPCLSWDKLFIPSLNKIVYCSVARRKMTGSMKSAFSMLLHLHWKTYVSLAFCIGYKYFL